MIGALVPVVAILGAFAVAITSILAKTRVRELRIRERIAMIEKGLVPPPEVDPAGFDRVMGRHEYRERHRAGRARRVGIILIGVGFGLMVLRYVDGAATATSGAMGAGGFVVVLGVTFLLISFFDNSPAASSSSSSTPPSRPPTAG
jgi:hypothetical protein